MAVLLKALKHMPAHTSATHPNTDETRSNEGPVCNLRHTARGLLMRQAVPNVMPETFPQSSPSTLLVKIHQARDGSSGDTETCREPSSHLSRTFNAHCTPSSQRAECKGQSATAPDLKTSSVLELAHRHPHHDVLRVRAHQRRGDDGPWTYTQRAAEGTGTDDSLGQAVAHTCNAL